jgi:hypothetical protein
MKKLFEKNPMVYYTFVLAVVSIACGIVIAGVNYFTAPVIADNLLEAKVEAFETVLEGIVSFEEIELTDDYPSSIQSVNMAYDAKLTDPSKELIGYIYEAYNTNKFGNMTIVVSVGLDGKVLGTTFVAIEQSLNVPSTRTNLSLYVGSDIANLLPSGDILSGATYSLETLNEMLTDIAVAHSLTVVEVIVDPLDEAYGEGYVIENDTTFVATTHVTSKWIVQNDNVEVGYMYSLMGSGDYQDGEAATIVVQLYFNLDDEIVSILFPDNRYNHSGGNFKNKNLEYVKLFTGLTKDQLQAVIDGDNTDITAGASNTRALIDMLLEAFISEVA